MIEAAIKYIRKRGDFKARIAIILGSGLGNFVESLSNTRSIPFTDIPGFPVSTITGHSGELISGDLNGIPVLVNSGRVHFYEGYSLDEVVYPVRILQALGAETLILTNAAGSIRKDYSPGTLMLITRMMNLTGRSVLDDANTKSITFKAADLARVIQSAATAGVPIKEGSYAGLNGPSYETPAEIRFLRHLKADAVGMSTVHECIMAQHLGLRVVGVSCLTNYAAGILDQALSHEEVIETGVRVQQDFATLLQSLVDAFAA